MAKEKGTENLLDGNIFTLKTTKGSIKLTPYSFSLKVDVMKSGFINKVMAYAKRLQAMGVDFTKAISDGDRAKLAAETDYIEVGEMFEAAMNMMWRMLPEERQAQAGTFQDFKPQLSEDEVNRFINWLISQLNREQAFLAQGKPKAEIPPE